ncbi:MAG: hypothetical protein ABIJ09_24135 [Pseudomonadota bacterium]
MNIEIAEEKLVETRRIAGLDLSTLPRERLEAVTQGLVEGLGTVYEALAAETRLSTIVQQQRAVIQSLTEAVAAASATMVSTHYRDILAALVRAYPNDPDCMGLGLYRAYRALEAEAVPLDDETRRCWDEWPERNRQQAAVEGHRNEKPEEGDEADVGGVPLPDVQP